VISVQPAVNINTKYKLCIMLSFILPVTHVSELLLTILQLVTIKGSADGNNIKPQAGKMLVKYILFESEF